MPAELIVYKCLETAIAVGFGCCGLARKETDLGTVSGAILAGTSLFSAWRQAQAKSGLNSEALIQKLRKELAAQFAWESIGEQEAADFADADLMIRNNLADCIPPMDELAGLITRSKELYPHSGALLIVDRLAQRTGSALFSTDGLCRTFALAVTEAALRAAMADDHYSSELRTHMIAALGDALRQLSDKVDRGFAEARAQHGQLLDSIPDLALRNEIMALVGSQPDASALAIAADVERFARDYRKLLDELAGFKSRDNELQDRIQQAKAALDQGDLATARRLFDAAVAIARERALAPVRDLVQVLDQQARAAMLASDWQAAEASWQQAIGLLGPLEVDSAESLAWDAAAALQAVAERRGDPRAMTAAIAHWEALIAKADARGETVRAASLQNNLANALAIQGERSSGEAGVKLLARAVAAYEAALGVYNQPDMPAAWAMTQNNLGAALRTQGERSGGEAGITLLARAVAAYEAALTVYTSDDMPADWAMTQNNLGIALWTQGARSGGEAGVKLLARAVAAYEAALAVYTSDDMPAQWAGTQNNLGNALSTQGERSGGEAGVKLLARAVAAYEAALKVGTRPDMPAQWAITQNNLGLALRTQGARSGGEAGIALLARAVAAYEAALTVRTEADMPADWAMTRESQAWCFESLADLGIETAPNLMRAEAAASDALKIYTPEHMSYRYEICADLLTRIREKIAQLDD